jgi:hypothetical protein
VKEGPVSEQDWETLEQWDNEPEHRHALARLRQEMEELRADLKNTKADFGNVRRSLAASNDHIASLESENTRLREALERIANWTLPGQPDTKLATEALERAEKATPGPWIDLPKETPKSHRRVVAGVAGMHEHHVALVGTDDDANFIAASRTDVPTLAHAVLELVEALEKHHHGDSLGDDPTVSKCLVCNRALVLKGDQ